MVSVSRKHPEIAADSPVDIDAWLNSLQTNYSPDDLTLIRRAAALSREAHEGQQRASGEPYFMHSLAVAQILTELNLDANSISAAMLHDVVEDTRFTLEDLQGQFGEDVAHLVDGVTKMDIIATLRGEDPQQQKEHLQAENLRKMLLAMAEDVRVVLIKLADRLHNMRTLSALPGEKQRRIARETMDIFAPLANRLGIWQLKWELEDLAFRYLRPADYKQIAEHLAERRNEREHYLTRFVDQLQSELDKAGIQAEVKGRVKHIYGIWKKMQRKQQAFHQIYDVRAVRIYVETIPACYAALGIVHTLWNYLPGEFDDYIATPKENNYRSIHTAVIGPEGKTVEVQIRTWDMHQESEYGVAAHWRYKEGIRSNQAFDEKIAWLRQLLEWKEDIAEAGEFVDQFKSEVFADRVYVFTPRGNIIDLPAGATPLDFAYRIHTEVGHHCRGAKVNGRMVSLTQPLHTGDQVEILSVKKGGPSRDWMNPQLGYLVTSKARQQVQRWFRLQNLDQNIADGRSIVERELKRLGFSDIGYEKLANQMGCKQVDEFLAALGRGDIKPGRIATAAHHLSEPAPQSEAEAPLLRKPRARPATSDIEVHGVGDLLTKFARCCKPVPGDAIVGFITQGQGVSIHRRDCHNVLRAIAEHPERFVEVEWGRRSSGSYPVDIEIQAFDRQGLLRDITTLLANSGIDVTAVNTQSHKQSHTATLTLTAEVPDIDALSTVLARINQLSNVTEVRRKTK
ncbi:GTP diphosphokinase [Thiohalophilus sp.]|uniref:GTP diphosphokinase n=1 Tax=Thiohalophilus sp. TaxID=3028392 RepID=UPI002ACDA681|nr:GTP diphosphokinase [Thiohalophilus sp.]MDZ7804572.1 GTP diphosphokinase [Thiohalophilus sp.]